MIRVPGKRCCLQFLCILLSVVLMNSGGQADDRSDALIDEGLVLLEEGNAKEATALFVEALDADPGDGEAAFYVGVGFNRAGDPAQAVEAFELASRLGYSSADMLFEAGWAMLSLGEHARALELLAEYEAMAPGRGKSAEFIGRAWLAMGDLEAAQAWFDEALRRDPSLTTSISFQRAAISAIAGDEETARSYLERIASNDPASPLGQYVTAQLEAIAPESGDDKYWRIIAVTSAGHDSNAISLNESLPLPSGITNDSGMFLQQTLRGAVDLWRQEGQGTLTLGGTALIRRYDDISAADYESFSLDLDYFQRISRNQVGRLQAYLGTTTDDFDQSNRYAGLRAAMFWDAWFDATVEPWASLTYTQYNRVGTVAPADERDGPTRALGVTLYYPWETIDADLSGGLAYSRSDTKGTNFDNQTQSLFVGVTKVLEPEITASLVYSLANSQFDNLDTRAIPPGAVRRHDVTHQLLLNLSRPITENFSLFGRLQATTNNSNVPSFDYNRMVTQVGVIATF